MPYSLNPLQSDCYDNSNVLINKFGITDSQLLDKVESELTGGFIAKAMLDIKFQNVDFEFYKYLHKYVFDTLYDWAGKVRLVEMSKNGTDFCPANKIEESANVIFERLKNNGYLGIYSEQKFIDEFINLYCSLNYLHPFREGNGRVQRLFLNMLLLNINKSIDFSQIDADTLMIATIKSVNGDIFMLKDIFNKYIQDI